MVLTADCMNRSCSPLSVPCRTLLLTALTNQQLPPPVPHDESKLAYMCPALTRRRAKSGVRVKQTAVAVRESGRVPCPSAVGRTNANAATAPPPSFFRSGDRNSESRSRASADRRKRVEGGRENEVTSRELRVLKITIASI